jgi:hypothetical protein
MGTAGAYGFRVGGEDRVTSTGCDSWPTVLGDEFAQFVRTTSQEEMRELVKDVELEPESETRRLAAARMFSDTYVEGWQEVRNDKREGKNDLYVHMPNANRFLFNSLSCEWAYIFDVDADCLEIYRGVQRKLGTGRYNRELYVSKNYAGQLKQQNYTGVVLVQTIPAERLRAFLPQQIRGLMRALEDWVCKGEAQAADDLDEKGLESLDEARLLIKTLMENPLSDVVMSVRDNFR